jgi:hypothetical protein
VDFEEYELIAPSPTKTCTTCLAELGIAEFYTKGNRLDAACKSCVKEKRRTTYLARQNELSKPDIIRLKSVVGLLADFELHRLDLLEKRFNRVIERIGNSI